MGLLGLAIANQQPFQQDLARMERETGSNLIGAMAPAKDDEVREGQAY